jgi:hypothetical protein
MQLKTITELLHLPNFQVVEVLEHKDTSFHFYIDLIETVAPVCSACGAVHHSSSHSLGWIRVEDLPLCGRRVFLYVPKRKTRCPKDNRIRIEQFDWMRGRFTTRFAEQVFRLTSITTNAEAGWYLNLDDETVYRIDLSMLEELAREKLSPVPSPSTMSVDEVAWQKWHKYVTNVVDIDKRKVIWNHNGRGKSTLDAFFKAVGIMPRKLTLLPVMEPGASFLPSRNTLKMPLLFSITFTSKAISTMPWIRFARSSFKKPEKIKMLLSPTCSTVGKDSSSCRGNRQKGNAISLINLLNSTTWSIRLCYSKNSFSKSIMLALEALPKPGSDNGSLLPLPQTSSPSRNWQ